MPKNMPDNENETKASPEKPTELLEHPSYEELLQKLDEAEQKANQYWERILRMQAENDNILRRAERDVANAHKYALEKFVTELLPIVDSLELCVTSVAPELQSASASVIEGVNLTLKMFYTAMDKFGIKQVNPVSEPFDPEHQQAISMQYDPSVSAGTVLSVLQKGYTLNNRLLRPALVIVSKAEK
ncbi:Protein GrpE [Aquicella siphonis]|uniref:Protein GrpE n=1 Tax=Aquicella siphonis TaxID=254247 RepID=A0A5E4PHI6_9COXI|nr:nucleotide exchange factor GrpE [Aquicella siphonis]VVC76374.1 Protein GrpE [Aquicella siphonis]